MTGHQPSEGPVRPRLLTAWFFAAGLFLLVIPWTRAWTEHPLLSALPGLAPVTLSPFVRGAVSGFGAWLLVVALTGEISTEAARPGRRDGGPDSPSSGGNGGRDAGGGSSW